jgi:hypothetical protein
MMVADARRLRRPSAAASSCGAASAGVEVPHPIFDWIGVRLRVSDGIGVRLRVFDWIGVRCAFGVVARRPPVNNLSKLF